MRIMDFQNNGMGDVVLGCWIVNSALAMGEEVLINPRKYFKVAELLSIPGHLVTSRSGGNWTQLRERGFVHELEQAHINPKSRFEFWAESLDLPGLKPVRPEARIDKGMEQWAEDEWAKFSVYENAPRVVIFPEATRETRKWPTMHWLGLVEEMRDKYTICVMTTDWRAAQPFDCFRYWGQPFHSLAAMVASADLVLSADSGAAHLASTLKVPVFSPFGPTIADVVFGHEPYAFPITTDQIGCVGCNFSQEMGYKSHCNHGCLALHLLSPKEVLKKIEDVVITGSAAPSKDQGSMLKNNIRSLAGIFRG